MAKYRGDKEWFLGLDIGTNSVGWAVTDKEYNILKFKGNAMWGIYLFDEAKTAADRRKNRTARRRLARKKQRIVLLQEFFAKEIAKSDPNFFIRIKESGLWADDRTTIPHLFVGDDYTDKDYYNQYPTIHHLIMDLINNKSEHNPRLVYLAISYILAHRGHFLLDVGEDNVSQVTDFSVIYQELINWFESVGIQAPWSSSSEEFSKSLRECKGTSKKIESFKTVIFGGKFPSDIEFGDDEILNYISVKCLIELICGKKIKVSDLFKKEDYKQLEKDSITVSSAEFEDDLDVLSNEINDYEYDLLAIAKRMYDWSLLVDILKGNKYISQAKIEVYDKHRSDLRTIKYFIKKYAPNRYYEVFRKVGKDSNYTSYSYNVKNYGNEPLPKDFKMCTEEEFCKYIEGVVKTFESDVEEHDRDAYQCMKEDLATRTFCPKQMTSDNRVIPYQLYLVELKAILDNASDYLAFLNEEDEYGSIKNKIIDLMTFKIPYFVGPLNSNSEFAWIKRKSEGEIYPWNFEERVDLDASEEAFIKRMTGKCSYLAGEDVLPKSSLLYSKFMVLNEINNIRVNGIKISVEAKQGIYNDIFKKTSRVTVKKLKDYLISNGYMQQEDELSGIDITVNSNLKSYIDFKHYIESGLLKERDVEAIIARITSTTDRRRLYTWLETNYKLPEDVIKKIVKFKYSDYGRLSKTFLTEMLDLDVTTGEVRRSDNIISMLWDTNENLMMLLSSDYGYMDNVSKFNKEYYEVHPRSLDSRLKDMYISNSVKRPILRVVEIVDELRKIMGSDPNKVFVEMARGATEAQKNTRTKSRRDQIEELYDSYKNNPEYRSEVDRLRNELLNKSDGELRSEKLFLYFTQLGRCMYSGEPINIDDIGNNKIYDVDHIWPQSKIKDDSLDNKVLVLSKYNGEKGDNYPIKEEWRIKQYGFWKALREKNLISEEKYNRLKRNTRFTDEELASFINRQLVETRQTTKAVAAILEDRLKSSKIVYVKAGLVSNFRQIYKDEYFTLKCREVNDLHHAKDAYLNIVIGNVYHVRFTENPLSFIKSGEKYTLNLDKILEHDVVRGEEVAWKAKNDEWFNRVIATIHKNNIRFVRYSYCQKGSLFKVTPLRKGYGQVSIKKDKVIERYGGYDKPINTYLKLERREYKGSFETVLIPVPLHLKNSVVGNYNSDVIQGNRIIKYNTLLEIDGYRVHISSVTGNNIQVKGAMPLKISCEYEQYIKRIVSFLKSGLVGNVNDGFNGISSERNIELYDVFLTKLERGKYLTLNDRPGDLIRNKRGVFLNLSLEDQAKVLLNILQLFSSNPSGKDLSLIEGPSQAGTQKISMYSHNWDYKEVYVIDQSPTGLFEKKSTNLLEL